MMGLERRNAMDQFWVASRKKKCTHDATSTCTPTNSYSASMIWFPQK